MIDSLHIQNYRLFKDLKINTLKRINLIVGKNNVGKSALLEAILIFISKGDIRTINAILHQRGEWVEMNQEMSQLMQEDRYLENYTSIFYKKIPTFQNHSNSIIIQDVLSIGLFDFYPTDDFSKQFRYGIGLSLIDKKNEINGLQNGLFYSPKIFHLTSEFQKHLVPSNIKFENSHLWDEISLTDKEDYVIQALQIIEPNLVRIDFNSQTKKPKARIKGEDKPVALNSMGDGINRILSIILSMVNCENSVFLIDEFEIGLHWSVQKDLWKMIFQLSEKLNIQVFATTHSKDTIKALQEVAEELNQGSNTQFIKLSNKKGEIKVIEFDFEKIVVAEEDDIEIR